jgi:hypothetical protein
VTQEKTIIYFEKQKDKEKGELRIGDDGKMEMKRKGD